MKSTLRACYASPMPDEEARTVRVQLLLTPSEAEAIDDWRFRSRTGSRNEAIRRLIEAGLAALRDEDDTGTKS